MAHRSDQLLTWLAIPGCFQDTSALDPLRSQYQQYSIQLHLHQAPHQHPVSLHHLCKHGFSSTTSLRQLAQSCNTPVQIFTIIMQFLQLLFTAPAGVIYAWVLTSGTGTATTASASTTCSPYLPGPATHNTCFASAKVN